MKLKKVMVGLVLMAGVVIAAFRLYPGEGIETEAFKLKGPTGWRLVKPNPDDQINEWTYYPRLGLLRFGLIRIQTDSCGNPANMAELFRSLQVKSAKMNYEMRIINNREWIMSHADPEKEGDVTFFLARTLLKISKRCLIRLNFKC
jgi:hypothetical protein